MNVVFTLLLKSLDCPMKAFSQKSPLRIRVVWLGIISLALARAALATENVPHAPFAQWADVPDVGQFITSLHYERSESYHMWAKNTYHNISVIAHDTTYGIDLQQGYLAMQYGLTERWTADLTLGYTTVGWRYFTPSLQPHSTTGVMDIPLGVRYQIFNETNAPYSWIPTLTFRAGGILPGTYSQDIAFAPGDRSAGIEPELLARKSFGWEGFGMYGDALFRWNHTTHNDHWIVGTGFYQKIKGWELNVGYRHLGTVQGEDIVLNTDPVARSIYYPRMLRENSDAFEAGFNYTTRWHHITLGFFTRDVVDGSNTDAKFWLAGYITVPFGGKKSSN